MSDPMKPDSEKSKSEVVKDKELKDQLADVLRLIPAQGPAPTAPIVRDPPKLSIMGRPRKAEAAPLVNDPAYLAAMVEARQNFINSDKLVQAVESRADPIEILFQVKASVAREASSLSFEQLEGQKRGRDTSQVSARRIDALKRIAEMELKLRELEAESINFTSERFQRVFALFTDKMREAAADTIPQEAIDLFFNRFATAMANWEEEASALANNTKK